MFIATLMNWTDDERRKGNAFIRIHDAYSSEPDIIVTVATGQAARKALEAAGWTVASGTRRNAHGQTQFTVERVQRSAEPGGMPGLAALNAHLSRLVGEAGI